MFRQETCSPSHYYRGEFLKLDNKDCYCFTLSQHDRTTGKFAMEKAPVYHIVD